AGTTTVSARLLATAPKPSSVAAGAATSSSPPPQAVRPMPPSRAVPTPPTPPRSRPRRDRRAPSTDSNVGLVLVLESSLLKSIAGSGAFTRWFMDFLGYGLQNLQ